MSVAAASYAKFCSEVVATRRAYTFTENGELLIYPVAGAEVVPFWSSRSRLERIVSMLPKYAKYEITELTDREFNDWLGQLDSESILVGANWAGQRLTGYNVRVADLRAAMEYQESRLGA